MAGVGDKELLRLGPWPAGIDNLNDETSLTRSEDGKRIIALREAINVDLPRTGWPRRRQGYGRIVAGTRVHSLWAGGAFPYLLFADGATQYAMSPAGTPWEVRSGLAPREISYAAPADTVYCTNAQQAWCIDAAGATMPWAVESPAGQPRLAASTDGGLDPGTYQAAVTFVDSAGREGGTGLAASLRLPSAGGIALLDIPQPRAGDVARVRVYLSAANGTVLHRVRDLPVGQLQAVLGTGPLGRPLETQFLEPMPPGEIVRTLAGRLWTASGNVMRWSAALRYGLSNLAEDTRRVGRRIDLMEPVGEGSDGAGLYVADHKRTYWIGGADPATQSVRIVYAAGAVRGSGITVPGNVFGLETTLPVAYWLSRTGVALLGLPGGTVIPLRESQVVAPAAARGASLYREHNGIRQVITALSGAAPQGLAMRDRVSARVYRNGVEV